jgi:hypothetical protein
MTNYRYQELLDQELDKLTHQRARQLWNRVDVRAKLKTCIDVPGIRSLLTMGSLEGLLKVRMSDVSIRPYIFTNIVACLWDLQSDGIGLDLGVQRLR